MKYMLKRGVFVLLFIVFSSSVIAQNNEVGEKCKEVYPGFNGPINERINLVFLGFNYENNAGVLNGIRGLIKKDDPVESFLLHEPLKSNPNKINFWYVDELSETSSIPKGDGRTPWNTNPDFYDEWKKLAENCNIPNNKINLLMYNIFIIICH